MHSNRLSTRLFGGFASTALYQAIAMAGAVLLVPLFIRAWGAESYGRWLSLTAFISYLSLLDLGGQNYIGNLLAEAFSTDDKERFRRVLSEGLSLFGLIAAGGAVALVGVLFLPPIVFPDLTSWISMQERVILLALGGSYLISIPQGVFVTVFRSTGLFVQGSMLGNIMRLLFLGVYGAILFVKASPVMYAVVYFLTLVLLTIVVVIYGWKKVFALRGIRLSMRDACAGKAHLTGSLYFWLLALAGSVKFQGAIVVLAAFVPGTMIAGFSTHRTASGLIGYIGAFAQAPVWPELTFMHARGERDRLRDISLLAVRTVSFLSAMAAVAVWLLLPSVYPMWTGKTLDFDTTLLAVLLVQSVLAACWNTVSWPLLASSKHRVISIVMMGNAGLSILAAVVLAPRFGIVGVAAAMLAGDLVTSAIVFPLAATRFLIIPFRRMIGAIALSTLPWAGVAILFRLVSSADEVSTVGAPLSGLIVLLLAVPLAWLTLGTENLRRLRSLIVALRPTHA